MKSDDVNVRIAFQYVYCMNLCINWLLYRIMFLLLHNVLTIIYVHN